MYYNDKPDSAPFLAGLLIGALVGASVAMLTTPKSGPQVRATIVDRAQLSGLRSRRSRHLDEMDVEEEDVEEEDLEEVRTRRRRSRR